MNKKKLITMAASLGLVAVIGVGATLAYMTSATEEKTNTFTVGHISAELEETTKGPNGEERPWDDSTDGKDMYPGESVVKEPVMTIKKDSANSYAFLQVTGADELVAAGFVITSGLDANIIDENTVSAFSSDWVKVADLEFKDANANTLDGIYRYVGEKAKGTNGQDKFIEAATEDVKLTAPIFDRVTYKTTKEGGKKDEVVGTVTVVGCAVQADGLSAAEALTQASFAAAPAAN